VIVSSLAARWIFPVAGPPIHDGLIRMQSGKILSVGPRHSSSVDLDLGDHAILPAFVNPHTHLDLSGAIGKTLPNPNRPFTDWLERIIQFRRSRSQDEIHEDTISGLKQSLQYGVGLIGDISASTVSHNLNPEVIRFQELLGLSIERANAAAALAEKVLAEGDSNAALSPHAPYSVRASLLSKVGELCRRYDRPMALHLAESPEELELLEHRSGPMVEFLTKLGVYDPSGLVTSPVDAMQRVDADQRKLFIHCNYLDSDTLFPKRSSVVYCPRTHAAFWPEHRHPFRSFLKRGINVAIGTDSLASNPDLDPMAEACFVLERYPDVSGESLLEMITLNGAIALGKEASWGTIELGKVANFVAIPISGVDSFDPHDLLFRNSLLREPRKLFLNGNSLPTE
jgi:aminodeoxyfutalosine deaminase